MEMKKSIEAYRNTGAKLYVPYFLALTAEGLAKTDELDEALSVVEEALSLIAETNERCWEADVHRVKGDVLRAADSPEAEASYLRAIEIAQSQQAKHWELRAAIGLARLWRDHGKSTQASDLLADIVGWFPDGEDSPDKCDARALLEDLKNLHVAEIAVLDNNVADVDAEV